MCRTISGFFLKQSLKSGEYGWLFSQQFQDHSLTALAVELSIVDLLPGTEVQEAVRDRHYYLVMEQQAL
jgi:hypothetical protein